MTPAPVDQPWDLETAWSDGHWARLELDRAWTDLVEAVGELFEPLLSWMDRLVT